MPYTEPCLPCIPKPCDDCPPPSVELPCSNGETCVDPIDAHCVFYRGLNLSNIGVNKGDRLDEILTKLNINGTSVGIVTENTNSIKITGSGIPTDKLKGNVNLDPITDNLIIETINGLKVQFNKTNILLLFSLIENDIDLQAGFCSLVTNCSDGVCGIPTGISATMV